MNLLIVVAVDAEKRAIVAAFAESDQSAHAVTIIAGGVGRTNAACATTQAILAGSFDAVISAGVAGAHPDSGHAIGDVILAAASIYFEEGLITPDGFRMPEQMGFPLGSFSGNAVPGDPKLLHPMRNEFPAEPIATVATCSGTDAAAHCVRERTGASIEAMEGAAVLHVASKLSVPAIELRAISNMTGNRSRQTWDLPAGLRGLGEGVSRALRRLG